MDAVGKKFGRLDILVNNAGINIRKPPQDFDHGGMAPGDDINLTSLFVCCQAAYPHEKAGGGKIINIGSMMSIFGAPFAAPYGASKGGVVQLTKSLASAWAGDNIQVNAVLPGWIDTELTRRAREQVDGLNEKCWRARLRRAGATRIWRGSRCFSPPGSTSSPAPPFRWTAGILLWLRPARR